MKNTKKNFLNSELSVEEKSKEKAKFHILPIPLEKTVSCGRGTSKGPEAIIERATNWKDLLVKVNLALVVFYSSFFKL